MSPTFSRKSAKNNKSSTRANREVDDDSTAAMVLQLNTAVTTAYGDGKIVGFRPTDGGVYTVRLAFGTLYAPQTSLGRRTPGVQINAAYASLEKMRRLNLEVQCHELGIPCQHDVCTICLLATATSDNNEEEAKSKPRWMAKLKRKNSLPTDVPPCLVCGSPTCPKHQAQGLKKQNMALCINCEKLFDLNFESLLGIESPAQGEPGKTDAPQSPQKENNDIVIATTQQHLEDKIRQLVDTYDRVMLLLTHASQCIPDLVVRLVATEARNNRVGLGTSGAGIVSGALGLAGAATILTPFGAPLLLASLALSGSSAAVNVGNQAINYYYNQEPQQAANQIILLHSFASSLLNAAQTLLRVAVAVDPSLKETPAQETTDVNEDTDSPTKAENGNDDDSGSPQKVITETVGQGLDIVRKADTGLNLANIAATSSVAMSSAAPGATNLIQSSVTMLNAVPLLGTALSGIFIAMDANRYQTTLAKIKAGHPSDKADALLNMQSDLLLFPQTVDLDVECQACLQVIEKHTQKSDI